MDRNGVKVIETVCVMADVFRSNGLTETATFWGGFAYR